MASDHEWRGALAGQEKGAYVQRMFGRIAPRYDLMNRLMTVGQDQRWRRRMALLAATPPGGTVLDLATGTGDVGLAVLELQPSASVVGADFALPMMQVGQRKLQGVARQRLAFAAADAMALPFPDQSFDAVLHAFLMRNIEGIEQGFREQFRVLKPGRRVVCLEITTPPWPGLRQLFSFGFGTVAPLLGGLISGHRDAYTYLPESVRTFPSPQKLQALMEAVGFRDVRYELVMLGNIAIHSALKPR